MSTVKKRLEILEKAIQPKEETCQVVLYDPKTGKRINEVDPRARVVLFLPVNGREVAENGRE